MDRLHNNFVQQGWQCPLCGRVYSPMTPMCFTCNNQKTVLSTGSSGYSAVVRNDMVSTKSNNEEEKK